MKPPSFMLIAGETSGDLLAAELVSALRRQVLAAGADDTSDVQPLRTQLAPRFFGAGGPHMAAAGVELAFDLTQHSVIGISDVFKKYFEFRRMFRRLFKLAIERQPDVIIGVDYGGFNLRFGRAIRRYARRHTGMFTVWKPKIVQFVSPQVWASRPGRALTLAENHDLVLSIFPFEKAWYARRVPQLKVEFVGHPMVERFEDRRLKIDNGKPTILHPPSSILLLPGSREAELRRHLPVMLGALKLIRTKLPNVTVRMVLPQESLKQQARDMGMPSDIEIQIGDLPKALATADLAIAKTGTVTLECAFFGVPAVTMYKTSWTNYEIGKRIVTVKWLTKPNLLADEEIFPEFVQGDATAENIARAALELLTNESRQRAIKAKLAKVVASLGGPGAATRAAQAICGMPNWKGK